MELDFDKYCVVDGSPTTVLPSPTRRSKVSCRKSNGKIKCGNEQLSHKGELAEIRFRRHRSASCRDAQSRKMAEEQNQLLKRGSVYQSSKEVRLQRAPNDVERKKIEFSRGSGSTFSFGIIDSLCSLDEDSSLAKRNSSEESTSSSCRNQEELHSLSLSRTKKKVASNQSRCVVSSSKYVAAETNDNNSSQERDEFFSLHKSLSAKLSLPQSDSDGSKSSSPRAQLNRIFNRSNLNRAKQTGSQAIDCKKADCESLLKDLSDKAHCVDNTPQCETKDNHNPHPLSSPAHLHGLLKMERKHGVLFFEFSVESPEDVYVAKTCKADNPLTWAYSFHSLHHRRKSSSTAWGFKENNKESSLVGQMLVSCYLCTELKDAGALNDSMVTEFVLYDVAHSRRSISSRDSSGCSPDLSRLSWGDGRKNEISAKTGVELHPGLEIAAVIMQVPFENRESLKFKNGVRQMDKPLTNLKEKKAKMHVVMPAGTHSLPSSESRGPSPLLDRWRLGGGCDCGGWDMACPLNVCGNPNFQIAEGQPQIDTQLFLQGRKDNIPAFTMRAIEEGKYAVDFHAQLSSLQAFSICVAILHAGQERSKKMLQSDSLRVFAEEEIKHLIDVTSEEEKLKTNQMEDALPSFLINPPFSPIARV